MAFGKALAGTEGDASGQQRAATVRGYNVFLTGSLHTIRLRISFTPDLHKDFSLREVRFPGGKPVSYAELPEVFRQNVEQARQAELKRLRETPKDPDVVPPPTQSGSH